MAKFLSPGVEVIETDDSNYVPSLNSSIVGLVGFASKGPVNEATLITSPQNLITIFGPPSEDIEGQAIEAALELLEVTNQLYFVRCAGTDGALDASAAVKIGGCPALQVSANGFGVTEDLWLKAQVYDNNGVAKFVTEKQFAIPSGTVATGGSQAEALRKVLGGGLDSDHIGVQYTSGTNTTGDIVGAYAGSGAYMSVSAFSDSGYTTGVSALKAYDIQGTASAAASAVTVYGSELYSGDSNSAAYLVESLYPGTGYNEGTKSDGSTSGNSVRVDALGGSNVLLQVYEAGSVKESFKVSLVNGVSFVESVLNTGETNLVSYVIKGNLVDDLTDITATALNDFSTDVSALGFTGVSGLQGGGAAASGAASLPYAKFIQGTYSLANGTDAIPGTDAERAVALIGDATTEPKEGMQALDDPVLNISLAAVPGISNENVQNALITLAESTQDFLAVVSPPYGIGTAQDAIDWSNGQKLERTSAINSSYAAIMWPWIKVFSTFDGVDRWYDPAIYGLRQMVYTDYVTYPWFAPAGFRRGRLTKPTDVESKLNKGDRDSMYSGGNIINPIVNFPQRGITVFGQRTATRTASALDRINVRRLMIQIRKLILASTQEFVFEPNDPLLWESIKNMLNPVLQDIKTKRGINQFRVVCDETTNTPARQDRNELWCRIEIKPTKTAEVLVFDLNLVAQTADLGE